MSDTMFKTFVWNQHLSQNEGKLLVFQGKSHKHKIPSPIFFLLFFDVSMVMGLVPGSDLQYLTSKVPLHSGLK